MEGYTKLFSDIVDSSIWDENPDVCKVWITLLALCNAEGFVRGSVGWLAGKAKVSVECCEISLKKFEAPDARSRTVDNDGKRIETVERGWIILNHGLFRARNGLSENPRRVYQREWMRNKRASVNKSQQESTLSTPASASASVPVGGIVKGGRFEKPEMPEMELYASKIGLPVLEINKFYDYYEANGWRVGRNPMKSWQAAMRNWKSNLGTYDHPKGNGQSQFWQLTKELEMVEGELKKITGRASQTATGIIIEPNDKASYDRLRNRRSEIKTKLQLK